jgi:hypothetical protein
VFIGLLRIAPGGLTFQASAITVDAYPPLLAQVAAAFCDRMQRDAITGHVDARLARRDACGLDRRTGETKRRISDAPDPATASRPVWRLQTPRYEGGMRGNLIWTKSRVKAFM